MTFDEVFEEEVGELDEPPFDPMPLVTGVARRGADGRAVELYIGEDLYVRADRIRSDMVTWDGDGPVLPCVHEYGPPLHEHTCRKCGARR